MKQLPLLHADFLRNSQRFPKRIVDTFHSVNGERSLVYHLRIQVKDFLEIGCMEGVCFKKGLHVCSLAVGMVYLYVIVGIQTHLSI